MPAINIKALDTLKDIGLDVLTLKVGEEITIKPSQLFTGKVVKSGNGASISFKKRFIGKEAYIIVKD
jgi:putative transposon-encoded protein